MRGQEGVVRLTREDAARVNRLRLERLKEAEGFSAEERVLQWSEDDERAIVLGVLEKGALVATQRMETVSSAEVLRSKLDYDGLEARVSLPCLVVGKAATAHSHAGRGLNSYLNALAIEHARRQGLRYVVETVVAGGPRTGFLRKTGFEFVAHPLGWRRFGYSSSSPVVIAILDLQRAAGDAYAADPRLVETRERYPLLETV